MSIFDCDPNEFTKPIKPYRTLPYSENSKRIEAMYLRLTTKVLQTKLIYDEAQLAYAEQKDVLACAEQQIDDWQASHLLTPRLSKRLNDYIYPWGTRISPVRYRKMIVSRRNKLLEAIEQARTRHQDAIAGLRKRSHFITSGRAWLRAHPSKIIMASNVKAEPIYEQQIDADGTKHLIIRNVRLDSAHPTHLQDIVSLDADEIVVKQASEGRAVRKQAGWPRKPVMPSANLIGDGVLHENSYRLCGKVADRGYLNAVIGYHFFAAATRPVDDFRALAYENSTFQKRRAEITTSYVSPDDAYSGWHVGVSGVGVNARYFVHPRIFDQPEITLSKFRTFEKQSKQTEPLLEKFSTDDVTLQHGAFRGKLCDPELWVREVDEFEQALHALDGENSFMLTGAAGTGKTHMIPGLISWCLANGRSVKVIAGGGALDVIETRCQRFMQKTFRIEVPLFWVRERDYLIFGDFDQREAFEQTRNASQAADILKRSKLIRPKDDEVDVLIIDEATLVPFDADLFERPRQIIVIGDLFQIARPNSVFAVATASGIQSIRLRRNFRANNCDIMTWSNIISYDNTLVVKNRGRRLSELRYVPLGTRNNGIVKAEVTAIINATLKAVQHGESVAIVAFSNKQLQALSQEIQKLSMPSLEFLGLPEDVQGKEADTVLVSLGTALTKNGRLPSRIEGLNDDQAIMKMNVAMSRARERTIVFSSLLTSDIDLRFANDAQAVIASVLETFSRLPSQKQVNDDQLYNRKLNT